MKGKLGPAFFDGALNETGTGIGIVLLPPVSWLTRNPIYLVAFRFGWERLNQCWAGAPPKRGTNPPVNAADEVYVSQYVFGSIGYVNADVSKVSDMPRCANHAS